MDTSNFLKIYDKVWFDQARHTVIYGCLFGYKCVCGYYIEQKMFDSAAFRVHYANKYKIPEAYYILNLTERQSSLFVIAM
jgi:hypothetical protein